MQLSLPGGYHDQGLMYARMVDDAHTHVCNPGLSCPELTNGKTDGRNKRSTSDHDQRCPKDDGHIFIYHCAMRQNYGFDYYQ